MLAELKLGCDLQAWCRVLQNRPGPYGNGLCQPFHHLPGVSAQVTAGNVRQFRVSGVITNHTSPVAQVQVC